MKNRISTSIIIVSIFLFGAIFISCNDKSTPAPNPGSLLLHMHTFADTSEIDAYGDTLILTGGRQISVNTAQLYISNVKLIKLDGSVIDGPSTIVFMKQGSEEYDLGNVPAGNYKTVRFDIGLSETINASTPVSTDQILYQPSMWFGLTAQPEGFVFVNFQGTIDTTNTATGTDLIPFAYKIGTNANRVTVTMPDQNYTVVPDQQDVIHIVVDYAKLFDGIPLNKSENLNVTTTLQNSWPWVAQMKTNIADMFHYE